MAVGRFFKDRDTFIPAGNIAVVSLPLVSEVIERERNINIVNLGVRKGSEGQPLA